MKRGRDPESVADFTDTLDPFQHQEIHNVGELKKEAEKRKKGEIERLRLVYTWATEDLIDAQKKKEEMKEELDKTKKELGSLRMAYWSLVEDSRVMKKRKEETEEVLKKENVVQSKQLRLVEAKLKKERLWMEKMKQTVCKTYHEMDARERWYASHVVGGDGGDGGDGGAAAGK
jgi:hypothetical protein